MGTRRTTVRAEDDDEVRLGKVLDFMRTLWAMDHRLQSLSKRMAVELGVTGPQRLALRMVGRFPDVSAGRLAELLAIHPSTLTGILQRLVDGGLLSRRPDRADGRRALFRLTAAGARLDALRSGTVEAAVSRALRSVSAARLQATMGVLTAVAVELERETT